MAVVTEYAPGTPCWFELATTNQTAAKQFYTQLFGWVVQDNPMGPAGVYTMFKLDGQDAAAAYTLEPKMVEQGVPTHWNVYFSVKNADESTAKAASLGGKIVQPPFDVMEHGRMAICTDPGGAVFALWQPKQHFGAGVINQNNTVCWCELATWDVPKAREFYTALFGWETKGAANMPTYVEFSVGGQPKGGLLPMDDEWKGMPSHWGIYFMVADCDATAAKAKELGAMLRHGPFDAPGVGRMAMLADPQGAGFSIIKLSAPMS